MAKAEFHFMRRRGYVSDGFATVGYLRADGEEQMLAKLQEALPQLTNEDTLVGVNGPALEMLLRLTRPRPEPVEPLDSLRGTTAEADARRKP